MGWYGRKGDFKDAEDYFRHEFAREINAGKNGEIIANSYTILDFEVVGGKMKNFFGTTAYAACKDSDGEIWAMVYLLEKSGNEYRYKPITENEGPYECKCPKRILEMLDAPHNDYAAEWRKKCGDVREWADTKEEDESKVGPC